MAQIINFAAVIDAASRADARDERLALAHERREPQIFIEPLTATAPPASVMQERLLRLDYEDAHKEPPIVRLTFRNNDLAMLQTDTLALGAMYLVSFGYPDTAITRSVTLYKVSGVGRSASGDQIVYEGRPSKIDGLHHIAGREPSGLPSFLNMRVSDAVRAIARLFDFRGASALIEQTEPVRSEIPFFDGETPLQFVRRMARRHDFTWGVHGSVFHFHSPGFRERNVVTIRNGGPQVLSWEFAGDFTVPSPLAVRAAGYNPRARAVEINEVTPGAESEGEGEDVSGGEAVRPRAPGESPIGQLVVRPEQLRNLTARERIPTSNVTERGRLAAERRFLARAARQWTLNMKLIGNPAIESRTMLDLVGYPPVLAGAWYVRGVRHSIDSSGYTTEIVEATRRAPQLSRKVIGSVPLNEARSEGEAIVSEPVGQLVVIDSNPPPGPRRPNVRGDL